MPTLKEIIEQSSKVNNDLIKPGGLLDGIISRPTFYSLIKNDDIPPKTQFDSVRRVANALGYDVVFEKRSEK